MPKSPILKSTPPFLLLHLFWRMYQPQVRINKMVNINYHPSPLEFTSRIHRLIFLWNPKGFISPKYFLNFFSNLYIPPWLQESFKFMVLRLLENTFVSQKTEFVPQAKVSPRFLSSTLQAEGTYPFHPNKVFWKSFLISRQGEDYRAENMIKIKLARSQILINSTICNLYIIGLFCCAII